MAGSKPKRAKKMAQASPSNSEFLTRKQLVDKKLQDAGWTIVKFFPNRALSDFQQCAIEEYPTDAGPADYALCVDGRILGVVEAKKLTLGPQEVLPQAERYSRGMTSNPFDFDGFHVPFLYSTNGEVIWHRDARHDLNRSRQLADFHTPEALQEFLSRDLDQSIRALVSLRENDYLYPFQREANAAIERAIANHKRRMLLAMATGTGKTLTMVNEVYRLMKSGVAKRILFLVDRRALAAQAVQAFASFQPEPNKNFNKIYEVYHQRFHREDLEGERFDLQVLPNAYLERPRFGHAFIYVSTIQRMTINLFGRDKVFGLGDETIDEDASKLKIPIHAFDLVIADECHRGYTASADAVWRETLDHFDAIKIGLTATPAAHTTAYFKDVVFRYEYERAVQEDKLVDYDVVSINSNVRMKGVFLKEGEQVGIINSQTGAKQLDLLEDERQFDISDIEEKVTSPDSNRKILEEVKKYALEHEANFGRFPKTLIFAVNDLPHTSHCDQLVDLARDIFGRGESFVQKITGRVDRPLQKIREFRNRQVTGMVVTVDMLSTGVDIPDLEFIVFLRPVKSRILFEQMLGRGTRKGLHVPNKSHFVVFDCFGGTLLQYFKNATDITAEPPEAELRTIVEVINDIWDNRDRDYNTRRLVKRLHRIDKQMSATARDEFAGFIPSGDFAAYAKGLASALHNNFTGTMALLRNPGFQDLLMSYERAPRTFLIAHDAVDTVSSEWLVRGADGKDYKPEDYLNAFARFVRENPAHIEAVRILLNRPRDWSTQALTELQQKLAQAPERFSLENLQKAHQMHYHKALVDIISMVKHAAKTEEPLLTAEERVARAFMKFESDDAFTAEQRQWLHLIQRHMAENLTIDKADFSRMPLFTNSGGLSQATRVFGRLEELLAKINEAVAA